MNNPYVSLSGPLLCWVADFGHKLEEPAESLYAQARELLYRMEREGFSQQLPADSVQAVRYALVALMDEMALQTQWTGRALWQQQPLQLRGRSPRIRRALIFEAVLRPRSQRRHPLLLRRRRWNESPLANCYPNWSRLEPCFPRRTCRQ